jgi:GTPase
MVIGMMEPYHVNVPSSEGKLLSLLKNESIIRELSYDEDQDFYKCKGFALKDHQISGQLLKYKV